MSRTTFQVGMVLQELLPGGKVVHLRNFAVAEENSVTTEIAGVMVRYKIDQDVVSWCYI